MIFTIIFKNQFHNFFWYKKPMPFLAWKWFFLKCLELKSQYLYFITTQSYEHVAEIIIVTINLFLNVSVMDDSIHSRLLFVKQLSQKHLQLPDVGDGMKLASIINIHLEKDDDKAGYVSFSTTLFFFFFGWLIIITIRNNSNNNITSPHNFWIIFRHTCI